MDNTKFTSISCNLEVIYSVIWECGSSTEMQSGVSAYSGGKCAELKVTHEAKRYKVPCYKKNMVVPPLDSHTAWLNTRP